MHTVDINISNAENVIDKALSLLERQSVFVCLFFFVVATMNRALLRPSYDGLIIHAVEQANKYKREKGEESGGAFWAVSHYSDGCDQMSCVTSWCRAYHNTSGYCFISAARLPRPDSRLHCADGKCGLSVIPLRRAFDCHREPIVSVRKKKGVFTWVVLGFIRRVAELNVEVDVEDGVAVLIPRD